MLAVRFRSVMVALLSVVVVALTGCGSAEKAAIEIQYTLDPSRGLPPGMNTVAVLDAQVNVSTDQKWSELAANYIQELVQQSNDRFGTTLRLADRKHTTSVLREADLAAAGLAASDRPGEIAQLLGVQGLIMAEINVRTELHHGKKTTLDPTGIFRGGTYIRTREVDTTSRHITVQTDFKLVDAATGQNWVTHSPPPYHRTDKGSVSPVFGSAKTEASMTPRDEIIGEAVEVGARDFVSKLVPCAVTYRVELESSVHEGCQRGVGCLRADMPEEALKHLRLALADDPNDHRAAFAAGVACEMSRRYQEALDYYRQACLLDNREEYLEAKRRVSENMHRARAGGVS